ncbi:hypothetical protein Mal52_37220 [Symmachiella dynata]|uniref:Uncharacterized protein n=1 Tax=Symmachiella dynata TaxID=2527995 RepID=A0A517ZRW6_9PLAN|nr:hypothetical protein [Symmachiella dynata]QDU45231.1 hypothetical protein Mal52_37220 [Symmachiella dynata]
MAKRRPSKKPKAEKKNAEPQGVVVNVSGLGLPTLARPFLVEFFPTPDQFGAEQQIREKELARKRREAAKALKKVEKKWWEEEGVVGVNVAYRTKLGHIVSPLQIVIVVDVVLKQPIAALEAKKRFVFPQQVGDIPVKVREIRYIKSDGILSSSAATGNRIQDPATTIIGGIQIAPVDAPNSWGTLGICVPHEESPGNISLVGISNKHVVRATNKKVQNPAGSQSADKTFGRVRKSTLTELADAASIKNIGAGNNRQFEKGIADFNPPGVHLLFLEDTILKTLAFDRVIKFGAATTKRDGQITNRRKAIRVPDLLRTRRFVNVIEVKGLEGHEVTDGGDSGGVILGQPKDENVWVVIGLIFAMSTDRKSAYAFPFGRVISKLNLNIPSNALWSGT